MTGDRSRAMRVYDWWSRHPRLFWGLSQVMFAGRERELREESTDRLGLADGETVLDLACGTGVNLARLADGVGTSGTVLAVDLAPGMVRAARERVAEGGTGPASVAVVRGDAARLPFREGRLDAAYASLSVSAMPDHERALESVYRTLRPGGRFVVLDAQPAQSGALRLLNPVVNRVSAWATNWYPDRDVPATLEAVFDDVTTTYYNQGTFYVSVARKAE